MIRKHIFHGTKNEIIISRDVVFYEQHECEVNKKSNDSNFFYSIGEDGSVETDNNSNDTIIINEANEGAGLDLSGKSFVDAINDNSEVSEVSADNSGLDPTFIPDEVIEEIPNGNRHVTRNQNRMNLLNFHVAFLTDEPMTYHQAIMKMVKNG